ncbi:MAG TPA: hypothetical protein VFP38_08880, partial [Bradyrhizobium sp.]|nr:hypothetical protein [Bradyrhizobium sp.]
MVLFSFLVYIHVINQSSSRTPRHQTLWSRRPMHFVDEVGEGLLNHGPALIAELLHGGLLRFFPERQGFQKR